MKPHMKVIQRNGVDIFVTSSMTMKETNFDRTGAYRLRRIAENSRRYATDGHAGDRYGLIRPDFMIGAHMRTGYLNAQRNFNKSFAEHVDSIKSPD